MLTVGSLFSGIGGFDLGLERAGMKVHWQAEIDAFAQRILRWHWPDVKLYGDVRDVGRQNLEPVDLVCGGFPCQDLSVAGRRAGLAGEKSGLFWELHRIVAELTPTWVLLENVPGLLSSNRGGDMGAVIKALVELGYGVAWRVLDAQYFGVAQRRRRVFIVGCIGSPARAAKVLFEPESCERGAPPGGETRQVVASLLASGAGTSRPAGIGSEIDFLVANTITTREGQRQDPSRETLIVTFPPQAGSDMWLGVGKKPSALTCRQAPAVVITRPASSEVRRFTPLENEPPVYLFTTAHSKQTGSGITADKSYTLDASNSLAVTIRDTVRRLTPLECERLQGFPDGWTAIDGVATPDAPRYRTLGNAVCVNVAEWIGRRIMKVEKEMST